MATCEGCGAEIMWAITSNGKKIPLDPDPEERFVVARQKNTGPQVALKKTYQTHFASCPDAEEFRRD